MKFGSSLRKGVLRDSDVPRILAFIVSFAVSAVLAVVLPLVFDRVGYAESVVALCIPFLALGVWDMACTRRLFRTVLIVAVPAVLAYLDWSYGAFAAMILAGSVGVSGVSDLLQRRLVLSFLDSVEHGAVRPKRTSTDRSVAFLFDIPSGMESRNLRMNATIRRESVPWRQFGRSMLPGFAPTVLLWMVAVCLMHPGTSAWSALLPVMAVSMYVQVVFQMVFVIGTLDVRVESAGREFRIFDGLVGTSARMAVPAVVGLAVVLLAESAGWAPLLVVVGSAVSGVVMNVLSGWYYSARGEADFVEGLHAEWTRTHPVDFYSNLDGTDSRSRLDDGVPGTPRRPADFCFQKN